MVRLLDLRSSLARGVDMLNRPLLRLIKALADRTDLRPLVHQQPCTLYVASAIQPVRFLVHSRLTFAPLTLSLVPRPPHRPPLRLTLHLIPQDRPALGLALSNSLEACRIAYMSALKEGDFVRWGNTKRVNGLKRGDQDALWSSLLSSESCSVKTCAFRSGRDLTHGRALLR